MAQVREIKNNDEFQGYISTPNLLNIIKVGANWCGPCRVLETTLHGLSQEEVEGVMLAEVNADEEWFDDIAAEIGIRGIPVLLAYRDGELKDRVQGNMPKDKLLEFFGRNK